MDHREELQAILSIKECDLRADTLMQCQHSADRGIHSGGALSAIVPLTALYYGGILRYNVENPTSEDQDIFLLSKGHAVAALASVMADVGYFSKNELKGSRGWGSLIKGHPGPVIPGVPVATGPLGQGISVACGYALKGKEDRSFDVYCMVGDGELQEGSCWEGILFAGDQRLRNLCLLVDKNDGQSDNTQKLFLSMDQLSERFASFGFRVLEADSDNMAEVLDCMRRFKEYPRCSKPTVILCSSFKGYGGYAVTTGKHKAAFSDAEVESEMLLLARTRRQRVQNLNRLDREAVKCVAEKLGYHLEYGGDGQISSLVAETPAVKVRRAPPRDKTLSYREARLPRMEPGRVYNPTELATSIAREFAANPNFYTIDADLSNVSGLYDGTRMTNRYHAINTGISECNMMCMAEGLAACGANVWVSTFGPFFNWQAFRRIAVSFQERLEVMETENGWLSEGHNLDITFLSTASNLDTAVNGATHMSNDDICFFAQLAHVKIIDVSCPQQLLSIAKWIAEGNRGLVYLRVMRNPSPALYGSDFQFEYGKGYFLRRDENHKAVIVSSGHGVLEAIFAAEALEKDGIPVSVVDMPSYDGNLLRELAADKTPILFAEQNNGFLFNRFSMDLLQNKFPCELSAITQLCTLDQNNRLRFIQSGTYSQLIEALGLTPKDIAAAIKNCVG